MKLYQIGRLRMNILIHIICVYIYNYTYKFSSIFVVSYFDTEGETLIYLVFLCLVMCDFICCFFCDLSLWRSSFYVSQISRPPAKIDGKFWEIDPFCG